MSKAVKRSRERANVKEQQKVVKSKKRYNAYTKIHANVIPCTIIRVKAIEIQIMKEIFLLQC
jgi:hypothetical protein